MKLPKPKYPIISRSRASLAGSLRQSHSLDSKAKEQIKAALNAPRKTVRREPHPGMYSSPQDIEARAEFRKKLYGLATESTFDSLADSIDRFRSLREQR